MLIVKLDQLGIGTDDTYCNVIYYVNSSWYVITVGSLQSNAYKKTPYVSNFREYRVFWYPFQPISFKVWFIGYGHQYYIAKMHVSLYIIYYIYVLYH